MSYYNSNMRLAEVLTFGTTVVCLMALPTYIGYKLNNIVVGIIVAGISTISYVLYFAIKKK